MHSACFTSSSVGTRRRSAATTAREPSQRPKGSSWQLPPVRRRLEPARCLAEDLTAQPLELETRQLVGLAIRVALPGERTEDGAHLTLERRVERGHARGDRLDPIPSAVGSRAARKSRGVACAARPSM